MEMNEEWCILLCNYMEYVYTQEGTTFVAKHLSHETACTEEQYAVLLELSEGIESRYK